MMSFVGGIGSLMDGSGTESILQRIYEESSIKQMLQGNKAILRAVCARILVKGMLIIKLQQMLSPNGAEVQEDECRRFEKTQSSM